MRFKLYLNCNGNKDSILNNQKGKCHCIWSEVYLWNSCSTLCKLSDKSILGPNVGDYLHFIYRNELEVKDTTDAKRSASDFVIHLAIDSRGKLKTNLYVECDYFTFPIINFRFISSNIPASPTYVVYISQLVRCSWACAQNNDFLDRAKWTKSW